MEITLFWVMLAMTVAYNTTDAFGLGELSLVNPAFVNRDITLHLITNMKAIKENPKLITIKVNFQLATQFHVLRSVIEYMHYDEKDGVWIVLKRVNKSLDKAIVYAVYNEYASNTIKISLQVFDNDCGYLDVIEYSPKTSDTSRIAYFPTQNVLDRNTDFHRLWQAADSVIQLKHGVYEERYVPLNSHYILSVYNVTKRTDYFLKCKRHRQYPRTNKVSVFVGNPDIGPLCSLDGCVDCVCVSSGENIFCKSSSEEVQIRIGINTLRLHTRLLETLYEHTINDVNNTSHMKTIECYARFKSNRDIWFRANGSLYIIVPPAELKMSFPFLKYGDLVNITCTAYQVRPPPKLQMTLDGKMADDARQVDVLNDSNQLFTSSLVKQLYLDRRWSNTTAICTSISILNYQEHTQVNSTSKILSYTCIAPCFKQHLHRFFPADINNICVCDAISSVLHCFGSKIGKKRHLCTQQHSPTEQLGYTSLWDRNGVHFVRDQTEHVYDNSEIEPNSDEIGQNEVSQENTQNQVSESQLHTNLFENKGQSICDQQDHSDDDNYDTIRDEHDGPSD